MLSCQIGGLTFGNTTGVYTYSDAEAVTKAKRNFENSRWSIDQHLNESLVVIDFQVSLQNHHQKGIGQNIWFFLPYDDISVSLK